MCDLVYSMGKVIASLNKFYQKEKFHQSWIAPDDLEVKKSFLSRDRGNEWCSLQDVTTDLYPHNWVITHSSEHWSNEDTMW